MPFVQSTLSTILCTGAVYADRSRQYFGSSRASKPTADRKWLDSSIVLLRDSIATILITGINIAGFLIGVFQLDIPFREALKTYTVLTVGDGLVTVIPSLLVSMAGGMVVTRASSG